jgi:hypothetical protein
MGRVSSTHFNPALGVKYLIRNTVSNQLKVARALGIRDMQYAPIRSNKDTPRGKEFFKMMVDDKPVVFINSLNFDECISEDGKWEFIGKRPDGTELQRKKSVAKKDKSGKIEFTSTEYKTIMGQQ